jgi:large conductance mechanosensitive channel
MRGFRDFLTKTNALALAIGVIIGTALGAVVNSLVNDIIMPPIGWALGGVDFAELKIVLGTDAAGEEVAIGYGLFINSLIAFVVIALVVYLVSRQFIKEAPPVPTKACPFCMEANAEAATKCKACTSAI